MKELIRIPFLIFLLPLFEFGCRGWSSTHSVGDLYGGGIVVAVWDSAGVQHGLIASLKDISAGAIWSNVVSIQIGSASESFRNGKSNTDAIIAQNGETSGAAQLCRSYREGGYSDWYLPALWELNLCYNSAPVINNIIGDVNGFQTKRYWSSTEKRTPEYVGTFAWFKEFSIGLVNGEAYPGSLGQQSVGIGAKIMPYNVRAVRRF